MSGPAFVVTVVVLLALGAVTVIFPRSASKRPSEPSNPRGGRRG